MTTKTCKAATKAVIILATYIFNHLNRICFTILSSDGVTKYNTCFENGRGSCTCDGNAVWHKECKHIKYLAPIAAEKLAARTVKTAPRQFESWLDEEVIVGQATPLVESRRYSFTDPDHPWYGLTDEQVETARANYEMAIDDRF